MVIDVYTDGSSLGNPGPGGFGCVVIVNGTEVTGGEGYPNVTNNQMELRGVIYALKSIQTAGLSNNRIVVHTDSKYVTDAFNQKWLESWQRRAWKTARGTPVLNKELWVELLSLTKSMNVSFIHVKGHSGQKYNELCDQLAKMHAERVRSGGTNYFGDK